MKRNWIRSFFLVAAAGAALSAAASAQQAASHQHMEQVMQRGATVMPFDLSLTTHEFDDEARGGVEIIRANRPEDGAQVELIRRHLADEINRFARGNFADPAWIHGADMPGLTELAAGYQKLQFTYQPLPDGASIRYASDDPSLVTAIHRWFAAQRMDHAAHGMTMPAQ